MTIQALKIERIAEFAAYCRKHRAEVDDSFLYDEDLTTFMLDSENPTYIAVNEQEEIAAAASLIADEYQRKGRKARFRIFHAESEDIGVCRALLNETLQHAEGLNYVYLFVPAVNEKLAETVQALGFEAERYSFLLVREDGEVPNSLLPDGYELRPFMPGRDEEIWCAVRNTAFAKLKGSETPVTPDMITKLTEEGDYLDGGMMILYQGDIPVGLVRCADDDFQAAPIMNIGPLAVMPEFQGQGLGRSLLRAALAFASDRGYNRTILCVNAENERAKGLYLQEGFKQVEAAACYHLKLNP